MDPSVKEVYIYIRTSAEKCFENVKKRQKPTDSYIDLEYLQMLERRHDDLYLKNRKAKRVIVVDGNQGPIDVYQEVYSIIHEIFKGIV